MSRISLGFKAKQALAFALIFWAGALWAGWWQSIGPLPLPRYGAAGAVLDGKLYLIGGRTHSGLTDRVDRYDPLTGTWSTVAPLPQPRAFGFAATLNGRIYFSGGQGMGNTRVLYAYDPGSDTWTSVGEMPFSCIGATAIPWENRLLLFPGERMGNYPGMVLSFDPNTGLWDTLGNIPRPRSHAQALALGDSIFWAGGLYYGATVFFDLFVPGSGWQTLPSLPEPIARTGLGWIQEGGEIRLLLPGGARHQGEATDDVYIYRISQGVWEEGPSLPEHVRDGTVFSWGGRVYVLGGRRGQHHLLSEGYVYIPEVAVEEEPAGGSEVWMVLWARQDRGRVILFLQGPRPAHLKIVDPAGRMLFSARIPRGRTNLVWIPPRPGVYFWSFGDRRGKWLLLW